MIINKFDYITSNYGLSIFAKNIWYKLICDNDYYTFTCNHNGCSDEKLKEILLNIKNNIKLKYKKDYDELIFDETLKEKIKLLNI